ncbi:hypothetical protein NE237_005579 [Protea cynaroides]|uniref:Uncharacterized protein n=1 Tax=Protea cynaroides TaxID=273540 RepID=A0A9Q0GLW8_9MAGN|nr:hypothetical protein NE237_005579 [Protea cynaroides]
MVFEFEIPGESAGLLGSTCPVEPSSGISGSSAGHTPFRSKNSSLGRDFIVGKVGLNQVSLPAKVSGPVSGSNSETEPSLPAFSILKTLSSSRHKSAVSGTVPKTPNLLPSPRMRLSRDGCRVGAADRTSPPRKGVDILSSQKVDIAARDCPSLNFISKDLELNTNGQEIMDGEGLDRANQN